MARHVLKDARVEVDGNVVSDHVRSVTINTPRDQVETTAMGQTAKSYVPGLKDATMDIEFFQDYAVGSVDAILSAKSDTDTAFTVKVRATSAAISTSNPEYSMSALLYDYSPMSGSVGDANTTSVTFANAGTGITRATS